jgi:hypothetical protein
MKLLRILIILLFLSGCTSNQPAVMTDTPAVTDLSKGQEGYPSPATAYPFASDPEVDNSIPSPTWTPDATKGVVTGVMLLQGEPVTNQILYLARVLSTESGMEISAVVEPDSPMTTTGQAGEFAFMNVPPGKYALILSIVVESYLLYKPESDEEAILVTVTEGKTEDLGTLNYSDLPISTNSNE